MHMAPTQLLFLSIVFLSVLPGADAVSTVSNVAVQRGGSVTIPCHYDGKYEKHVKYWCKGSDWNICSSVVRTDSLTVRGKTSITDDPIHHVFSVTIQNPTLQETGVYWCGVEIDWVGDERRRLQLYVTAKAPGLWVDQQEVTGVEGGHVSVRCHYSYPSSTRKWWCGAKGSCVEVNSAKSGRAEIKDDRSGNVFIVILRDLKGEDAGWYWCTAGVLQIPVHITVTQKTTTTTVTTTTQCATSRALCTSLPVSTATTSATATKPSTSNNLALTIPRSSFPPTATQSKSPSDLTIVLMTSGILLLVVTLAMVTWKLWKKHKSVQSNARARKGRRNELVSVGNEDVIYSRVFTKTQPPSYRGSPPQSQSVGNGDVIYSRVFTKTQPPSYRGSSPQSQSVGNEDVIYSRVFTKTQPPSYRGSPPQSQPSENPADEVVHSSVILQNPQVTPSPNQSPAGTPSDVIYSSVAQQKK